MVLRPLITECFFPQPFYTINLPSPMPLKQRINSDMEVPVKLICLLGLLLAIGVAEAAGPCGKSSPDDEAMKLAPCGMAAQDEKADVPASCCMAVKKLGQNPSCLCAILLSDTAKNSGIKAEIAITIPKRCNIANRPVGYKCGPYTLP